MWRLPTLWEPPREPDFFELLQAGMTFGSLGQTLNNSMADVSYVDTYTYNQVLQTGANLMDQYDADSFPTTIVLHVRPGDPTSDQYVYGIECLPYLTQVFNLVWRKDITQGPRYWYQPAVWNPQNTLSTAAGPTNFRFIVTLSGYPQLYIHFVSQKRLYQGLRPDLGSPIRPASLSRLPRPIIISTCPPF